MSPFDPLHPRMRKAAQDSWNALKPKAANSSWNAMQGARAEALLRHTDVVAAYFAADFNTEAALRAMTSGKMGMNELEPEGVAFHNRLSSFLREWAKHNRS